MSFFSENLSIKLNAEQLQAVNHFEGPALVLAVPGSGKTTMLICRTINLIEKHHVDPRRILSLTFSKAAALDMTERFNTLFPDKQYPVGFSTIHRFCYSVLLQYFKSIDREYVLIESKESPISKQQLLRKVYSEINQDFLTEDLFDELNAAIGYCKNMMTPPEDYETKLRHFAKVFEHYESYKKKHLLMDFDDMLTMCYQLLKAKPAILKHYQTKFDFIQVDESQDTSKVQHAIIQLLTQAHQNIFMVADDDQSIYGFRGAYPDAILKMDKLYPDVQEYQLSQNYRSSRQIIEVCQQIIEQNMVRKQKQFNAHHKHNADIKIVRVDTTAEQCAYIVDAHKTNDLNKAVLYRNNLSMIPLVDYLDREDVDFSVKDAKHNFFTNWCILDIIAFIKVALVPNDMEAFERIYYKMNAFISKQQIQYIKDHYNGINLFDQMINLPQLEKFKQATFRKIKGNFEQLGRLSPDIAIDFIEDELNYKQYLNQYCKKNNLSSESQNKYVDIIKVIASNTNSLTAFLERMDALKTLIYKASHNKNPYALKLLTMHASKGLEFDHVFIIDIDHNVFPSKYALDKLEEHDHSHIEEERRLFYVALSRAKHKITLVHTKFKNGQYNKASDFMRDFQSSSKEYIVEEQFSHKKETAQLDGFEIGDKLLHTSFGVGHLIDIDGDRIMIEFKNATKTLSAAICNDSKIIMKID